MIFVTTGTQKFQFNRLIKAIDNLVANGYIKEKVICQSGASDYNSKNLTLFPFMSNEQYEDCIKKCDLLITHAGVGTILEGKNIIKKY